MAVLSHDDVYRIAIDQGATPDEAQFLAAVAGPESGYNTEAHNPNASTGDNSYGLLQINMLGRMGEERAKNWGLSSYDDLYDPATNIRAGLDILRSQGKSAWTTYTSGAYKQYDRSIPAGVSLGVGTGADVGGGGPVSTTGEALLGAASAAGGQQYAALKSQQGDSLGDRLQSVLAILKQGPMSHV